MSHQNLNERAAVIALAELSGKVTVRQGRDHLKRRGLLPTETDLIEEGELDFTRKIFQKSRKYENDAETGRIEYISLFERDDSGNKWEYYKKAEETTVDEAIQHLEYWNKYRRVSEQRLRHWYKRFCEVHGKRKIQQRLTFEIPPDPIARAGT